jgi:type II secretory pathway pseudopilin PulG
MKIIRHRSSEAFTLMEIMVAASVILIFSLGAIVSLTTMNRRANAGRLQTLALAAAQQKIDDILTTPWSVTRPALLQKGTVSETYDATSQTGGIRIGNDPLNAQTGLSSAFTGLDLEVPATRTTVVDDLGAAADGKIIATVTVTFKYRGRDYTVTLKTIRVSDTI